MSQPGPFGQQRPQIIIVNLVPAALTVLGLLALYNFFGLVRGPLLVIVLATLLAAAINPIVIWLEERLNIARGLAAGLTVLLALTVIIGTSVLVLPLLISQLVNFFTGLSFDLDLLEDRFDTWLERFPFLQPLIEDDILAQVGEQAVGIASGALSQTLSVTASLLTSFAFAVIALILILFTLARPGPLVQGLLGAIPQGYRQRTKNVAERVLQQLGAWGRSVLLVMLIVGVVMGLGLYLLGVENWLLYGVLAALGELIPNIGPILAVLPPVLFTLAEDPDKALWVALLALVVQQLESHVLTPFVLGGAAHMHPVSVTVGVLIFGSVFGVIGAFLTVPFMIILKAVYEEFYLAGQRQVSEQEALEVVGEHSESGK
ncbi:AI-2E family transporter [Deinococcus peraridilitoris]|uniref:Putative permease n=1 Tax=Deinococcus peraridilitoris (strain DSM 19664 / LMG 22246 / CIP 109416 / KR-200) TaxID=937777 RepID=L0A0M8_DEIPD|nr:AI-2E family transporter [Deinococcus peraridilitoris]AFZ66560.1 putative permease [Deinococcus peraridilitoris DSM 19664]